MQFRLLGPVEVVDEGRPLVLGSAKQRALLAILLLHANEVVSRDRLIDELWGEQPPASAPHSLEVYVSRLRKALQPDGGERLLVTRPGGYLLQLEPDQLDLERFERLVEDGRRALADGDNERAAERLAEALALWRGPALGDLAYEPFAIPEVERLEEQRLAALEEKIEAQLALGRHGALIGELEAVSTKHPLRERMHGQLMLALYRCGRQADALDTYKALRRHLRDELGLDPSPALQRLEQAILRQDPTLELAAEVPAGEDGQPTLPKTTGPTTRLPPIDHWRPALVVIGIAGLLVAAVVGATVFFTGNSGPSLDGIDANAAGLIDAKNGQVLASISVGGRPAGIAAYHGAVWVANTVDGTVLRIDPDTKSVEDRIVVGNSPSGLAGGEGGLWVTSSAGGGTVSEINPDANRVVQTISVGNGPRGVAVGGRAVWVANSLDGTVARIDPKAGVVTRRITVGGTPSALAVGGGVVWVASETTGTISRIDLASGSLLPPVAVGNGPTAVAFGAGAAWVANSIDGTVFRIDAATSSVTDTADVGDQPEGIAVGSGGVWVANGAAATIVELDPQSAAVKRTISVVSSPRAIDVSGQRVWISAAASPSSHRGGLLRVSLTDDNGSLDPATAQALDAWSLMINVYDGLVAFRRAGGAAGGTLVPDLATRVPAPAADGKTYTFQVRRGVRYSNGQEVRPRDFRYAIERVLTRGHYPATFYSQIVGAASCTRSPKVCKLSKGIVTDDKAGTVSFHLVAPDPDFLYKLALTFASAVPFGDSVRNLGTHPPPGTGPYKIASYRPRHAARLVRNPRFRVWSDDAQPGGFPDVITATSGQDTSKQVNGVLKGRGDVASLSPSGLPPRQLRTLRTQYAAQLHVDPLGVVVYLFLNTHREPFSDLRVRRALDWAADRGQLTALAGGDNFAEPTCQILPPGVPGYRPYCPYTLKTAAGGVWSAPNHAQAARLVAMSHTSGRRVVIGTFQFQTQFARPLMATLARLGYRPVRRDLSAKTDTHTEVDGALLAWGKEFAAASDFIDPLFTCQSPFNPMRFCDPAIDAEARPAATTQVSDPVTANAAWARIDRGLVDRAAAIPLFTPQSATLLSKRVGNYQFSPQWGPLLDQLWVR